MALALERLSGTVNSLVSSTSGQLPASAEIEEVRERSCAAMDLDSDAEEGSGSRVAYSVRPPTDGKPVNTGSDPAGALSRLALDSVSFIIDTIRA